MGNACLAKDNVYKAQCTYGDIYTVLDACFAYGGPVKTDHEQAYAIGPEISFAIPACKAAVSLRVPKEFENRTNPRGLVSTHTITRAFHLPAR